MKHLIARTVAASGRHIWLWHHRNVLKKTCRAERPRLLVDVSAIIRHDAQTGIQRVVRAVWSELSKRAEESFEIVPVFAAQSHGYCYAPTDFLYRSRSPVGGPVIAGTGDVFLGLDLSAHLLPKYSRQLRTWRQNGATICVVVYDVLPLVRPEWFSRQAVRRFRKWFDVLRTEVDLAFCISEQVGRELCQELAVAGVVEGPSIARLQMGGDIGASLPSHGVCEAEQALLDRLRFRPAILMVGTVEPRKGYDIALAAFEHLWSARPKDAPDLVIVGRPGWKTERLQRRIRSHPQHGKRLHWLDKVSDEALCGFYDACRAVFMASKAEGFGLPLLEAAAHRRFILARDLPVFREQSLTNVLYFSDDRAAALSERLMDLLGTALRGVAPVIDLPLWSDCVDRLLIEIGLEKRGSAPRTRLREVS